MRLEAFAAALLLALGSPAAAQFPGALSGVVTDGGDGAPIAAALVEMGEAGRSARTDAAGAFVLRGLDAGTYEVWVRRAGYAPRRLEVVVHDGQARRLDVSLMPLPLMLDSLRVASAPDRAPGEVRLSRPQIEASGARTLADLLERTGAAVVSGTGPTSERRVSIRGGSADAVLVLVDGVPANDAVTGEADLSQIPASSIERLTLLSGARSARYGPRAETGVILVRTRWSLAS